MRADAASRPKVRYRFPPLERRGVIAGWRGGQIAVVAGSLVCAVAFLRARPSVGGLLLSVLTVAAGVAVAFWPVRGRTPEQWLPLVARWSWLGSNGQLQLSPGPQRGHLVIPRVTQGNRTVATMVTSEARRTGRRRTGVFDGLRLVGLSLAGGSGGMGGVGGAGGDTAGVVFDERARTATAVLTLRGRSFALLSGPDQEARVAAWASVLASLAREGSEVHRLQWVESCLPDDGGTIARYFEDHAVVNGRSRAASSYRALLDEAAPISRRHRVLLGVTVHVARSARAVRTAGGADTGAGVVLGREVQALGRALDGADVEVEGVLGPVTLARCVAEAIAPAPSADHRGPDRARSDASEATPSWPWPMALRPEWDAVRVDGTWHATYWIAEWPRVEISADFLGPMLLAPVRRSIALVMEPVSPSRAARQVARARTADIADGELRRRGGFLTSARQHRERHSVEERDAELAEGHGQFRFVGYVTLTARTRDELDAGAVDLEQLAGQSHVELRRLYGEQDVAFACSLPLGRGLA